MEETISQLKEENERLREIIKQYEMAHTDDQVLIHTMSEELAKLKGSSS